MIKTFTLALALMLVAIPCQAKGGHGGKGGHSGHSAWGHGK